MDVLWYNPWYPLREYLPTLFIKTRRCQSMSQHVKRWLYLLVHISDHTFMFHHSSILSLSTKDWPPDPFRKAPSSWTLKPVGEFVRGSKDRLRLLQLFVFYLLFFISGIYGYCDPTLESDYSLPKRLWLGTFIRLNGWLVPWSSDPSGEVYLPDGYIRNLGVLSRKRFS